ncbi:MAG: hypothetical protein RL459_963 [Pseudomonadota bacterium]|jgi:hypothetical protein
MAPLSLQQQRAKLAQDVRVQFVFDAGMCMVAVGKAVQDRLTEMLVDALPLREMQLRRDAWTQFKTSHSMWVDAVIRDWQAILSEPEPVAKPLLNFDLLELVSDDVADNKILASRLALAVMQRARRQFDDLSFRIKHLESREDLRSDDLLRCEALLLPVIEQWHQVGMSRAVWPLVNEAVQQVLTQHLFDAYTQANRFLKSQDLVPSLDDRYVVKKAPELPIANPIASPIASPRSGADDRPAPRAGGTRAFPAQQHAQPTEAVLGQIRQLLLQAQEEDSAPGHDHPATTMLAAAIAAMPQQDESAVFGDGDMLQPEDDLALVTRLAGQLRKRSTELKKSADSQGDKATIEIVALMFQSILQDERVPPSIRVWFARMQIPVLRVALEDPEFLSTTDHPARLLIDRMGSCVLGFDASGIQGGPLEGEVRRVVQVVEQYSDTGSQVYELVLEEFQAFLAKHLTDTDSTRELVSVAQQLEQKETLVVQYTIELRHLFDEIPAPEEIRHFLFRVWVEVLALATVRLGPQHEQTLGLRKVAGDLVAMSSAKPGRVERVQAIRDLPALLERLREGMALLGLSPQQQDMHIKTVNDTMAQAFLSKTQAMSPTQVDDIARRLAQLEDYVGDEEVDELPLDAQSIDWMLGPQAATTEVIMDGGTPPTQAMKEWARDMLPGSWFVLDHNGHISTVQFLWRSAQGHLNLMGAKDGRSYVIQAGRLASYLQAGLLKPQEDEPLMVRATRDALAKIEANPERLLS